MTGKILNTISNANYLQEALPYINQINLSERGIFIIFSTLALKYLRGKVPGISDISRFWTNIVPEGYPSFDRSLIRAELRTVFDSCLKGEIHLDLFYLKELEKNLEKKENHQEIAREIFENYQNPLREILKNIKSNSKFCKLIEDLLKELAKTLSGKALPSDKKFLSAEEFLNLEELLNIDLKLIKEFVYSHCLSFLENTAGNSSVEDFLIGADLIIQQDLDLETLLEKNFIPLSLKNNNGEEIQINGNFNLSKNWPNRKKVLLIGESGSGKSILGLKFCTQGLQENYHVGWINLEKYNSNNRLITLKNDLKELFAKNPERKSIFFLDNLERISFLKTRHTFSDFFYSLTDNPENIVIISSRDNRENGDSMLNSGVISRNCERFYLKPLANAEKSWIRTPLEQVIFSEIKERAKNNGALYYLYIDKILLRIQSELGEKYSFSEIKHSFQKIAFHSVSRQMKIDELRRIGFEYLEPFINENKLLKVDYNNYGEIVFANSIFRDFLAAGYLISLKNEELKILNVNFEEYHWRKVMLNIAEWLGLSITNLSAELMLPIFYHLRQKKEFSFTDEVLKILPENQFRQQQEYYLNLEKATSFYYQGNYNDCIFHCKKILLDLFSNKKTVPEKSRVFNLLASCLNDLHLPGLSLPLLENGITEADQKQTARLIGNKARAMLKLGKISEAEKLFLEKQKMNQEYCPEEKLRDENDLLLLAAFCEKKSVEKYYQKAQELLQEYQNQEIENEIDDSGNKAYVFRNFSYFLPHLSDKNEVFFSFVQKIHQLPVKETGPSAVCLLNSAIYLLNNQEKEEALKYLQKAVELFEKGEYLSEHYICLLYLYLTSQEEQYRRLADTKYEQIYKNVQEAIRQIGEMSLLLNIFGIDDSSEFLLKKIHQLPVQELPSVLAAQPVF